MNAQELVKILASATSDEVWALSAVARYGASSWHVLKNYMPALAKDRFIVNILGKPSQQQMSCRQTIGEILDDYGALLMELRRHAVAKLALDGCPGNTILNMAAEFFLLSDQPTIASSRDLARWAATRKESLYAFPKAKWIELRATRSVPAETHLDNIHMRLQLERSDTDGKPTAVLQIMIEEDK